MNAALETDAWSVSDDDDGMHIRYGTREEVAAEFNLPVSEVTRQPWADAYAPNDPPAKAWIENGFTYTCAECEHQLDGGGCEDNDCQDYDEETDEHGDYPEMVFFGDEAFCSQKCADAWKRDREERAEIKRDARAMFEALVPIAEIQTVFVGALGVCEDKHNLKAGVVRFKTPTMKEYGDWCSVCRTAHVAAPDVEAFKASRERTGARERKWHWRTWNLLLQIREATDGEDCRQLAGEMTERSLCVAEGRPDVRALASRGWIKIDDYSQYENESGFTRVAAAWVITDAGRKALALAQAEGIQVQ